jgi:hypothetical protein
MLIPLLSDDTADAIPPSLKAVADALAATELLTASLQGLPIHEPWGTADAPGTMSGIYPWVPYFPGNPNAWGVKSGALELQGTGGSMPAQVGRMAVDTGRNDLRVTLMVEEWHDTGTGVLVVGPCLRMQGDASMTFYAPTLIAVDGVLTLSIQRFIAGAQVQVGPSVPITPHVSMTIGLQIDGQILSAFFDGTRVIRQADVGGIATGHFVGIQGVASGLNRVRVRPMDIELPSAQVKPTPAETLSLVESLRRRVSRALAETLSLTEAEARQAVLRHDLAEGLGLAETLARTAARPHTGTDTVGLFETLGIAVQTHTPQFKEDLGLQESLVGQLTARTRAELLALTESLSRVFRAQTHVGILQLTNESVLVSGASARVRVTDAGVVRQPIPELSGFEYTADLIGRDGVIIGPADLDSLQVTLYNLDTLGIVNGASRAPINNVGRGILTDQGRLTITVDALDTPILDPAKPHEHHILLIEGTYDGGMRAFRRAVDHVVVNMSLVP